MGRGVRRRRRRQKNRLTPVLYFLFTGMVLASLGVLPEESGPSLRNAATMTVGIAVIQDLKAATERA